MQHKIFTKNNAKSQNSASFFSGHAKVLENWQSDDKLAPSSLFQQSIKNDDYKIHVAFKPEKNICLLSKNTR